MMLSLVVEDVTMLIRCICSALLASHKCAGNFHIMNLHLDILFSLFSFSTNNSGYLSIKTLFLLLMIEMLNSLAELALLPIAGLCFSSEDGNAYRE